MNKKNFKHRQDTKNGYAKKNESDNQQRKNSKRERFFYKPKQETPLKRIEYPEFKCAKCGEMIKELTSAIADKESGLPVHFTCVLNFLKNAETLGENEEIIYIGNGNFAIVFFENPKVRKNFKIKKLIEWEEKGKVYDWKLTVADLVSQI